MREGAGGRGRAREGEESAESQEGAEGAEGACLREACRDLSREVAPQPVALTKRVAQLEPARRSLHQPAPVSAATAAAIVAATRYHTSKLMRRHP